MLYRSTDRLCRCGAPVENLSHNASFSRSEKYAPSNAGTKHLVDSNGNPVYIYDPLTGNANGSGRSPISRNGVVDMLCLSRVDPAALILANCFPPDL
jgi:hypothetical protein